MVSFSVDDSYIKILTILDKPAKVAATASKPANIRLKVGDDLETPHKRSPGVKASASSTPHVIAMASLSNKKQCALTAKYQID